MQSNPKKQRAIEIALSNIKEWIRPLLSPNKIVLGKENYHDLLPLFINIKTAAIKRITTRAKTPIIKIPLSHFTKGSTASIFIIIDLAF